MSAGGDRRRLVAAAHASVAGRSPALAFASRLLDRRRREHGWLLYAWCRAASDLVAGPDPELALAQLCTKTRAAQNGDPPGEVPFDALALLVRERDLPPHYPWLVIEGLAMDVTDFRPHDEADLYRYCEHVAGAPAAMAAIAFGIPADDAETLERAADLGIACRLVAIARDISADAAVGRCYLPDSWLSEMDIPPGEHMKPPYRKRLAILAARLGDRAETLITSARRGVAALPFRPAWAALTVIAIHGDIIQEVVDRGEHGWDHRVGAGGADRIDKAMKAAFFALLRRRLPVDDAVEPPWRPVRS